MSENGDNYGSIKEALLASGWEADGQKRCPRCGDMVDVLKSPGGVREQYFNPTEHPDRPNIYHKFSCGIRQADQAPTEIAA